MPDENPRDRLKVGQTGAIELRTAQDAIDFATWTYESGYLPDHVKNPKQAFTIMQRGAEMGLPPFAAWRYIYQTRGGKLALESKGALAVCQAKASFSDYQERIEGEGDAMRAVAVATRKGAKPTIKEFTMDDARRAGLLKRPKSRSGGEYDGPWQSYLKDMLLSKARERALAICFAAELGGIPIEGVAEEIEARQVERAEVSTGFRERIGGAAPKALPEGQTSTMTDLIRGKDYVPAQAVVVSPDTVPAPLEQVIADQVDKALKPVRDLAGGPVSDMELGKAEEAEEPEEGDPKFPEPE